MLRSYRFQIVVTIIALVGLMQGIMINEHCARSYIPTEAEMAYYYTMLNSRFSITFTSSAAN